MPCSPDNGEHHRLIKRLQKISSFMLFKWKRYAGVSIVRRLQYILNECATSLIIVVLSKHAF
jgi:hypothetical protein